jgi:hypothetical protein
MSSDTPKNLQELFEFYFDFVKPLYSEIQTRNELPYETLFELNAAFDHVSRIYTYGRMKKTTIIIALISFVGGMIVTYLISLL